MLVTRVVTGKDPVDLCDNVNELNQQAIARKAGPQWEIVAVTRSDGSPTAPFCAFLQADREA